MHEGAGHKRGYRGRLWSYVMWADVAGFADIGGWLVRASAEDV